MAHSIGRRGNNGFSLLAIGAIMIIGVLAVLFIAQQISHRRNAMYITTPLVKASPWRIGSVMPSAFQTR